MPRTNRSRPTPSKPIRKTPRQWMEEREKVRNSLDRLRKKHGILTVEACLADVCDRIAAAQDNRHKAFHYATDAAVLRMLVTRTLAGIERSILR